MALPATIDFSSATYNAGENPWTTLGAGGSCTIIPGCDKGRVASNTWLTISADAGFYWSADSFADDQYCEVRGNSLSDAIGGACVRIQTGDSVPKCYMLGLRNTSILRVFKVASGSSFTQIGADISVSITTASKCRITATGGATTTLTVSVDGVDITTRTDSTSPYTSGSAGLFDDSAAGQQYTWFSAGNVAAAGNPWYAYAQQ